MSLMDWNPDKFNVMVPLMNQQHEKLVGIMNKLYVRVEAKAPKAELNQLLVELRDWTVRHFHDEELLLDRMQFPDRERHKNIHAKLLEDFTRHYQEFSAGPGVLSKTFFDFLRLWLTSHIMHIDRKYGEYSQHRGAA